MSAISTGSKPTTVTKRRIWEHCEHVWIIRNFETLKMQSVGYKKSCNFGPTICGRKKSTWCLIFYPAGSSEAEKDYVSLSLNSVVPAEPLFFAKATISVRNSDDEIIKDKNTEYFSYNRETNVHIHRLMKKDELISNITDGVIKIAVSVSKVLIELETCHTIDPDPILTNVWNSMFKEPKFSDVVLVVGGEEIKAHRLILSAQSPVFMAMFSHEFSETTSGKVEISEFKADTIRSLLRFMYTGELEIEEMDEAVELVKAAEKYDLKHLKLLCTGYLKQYLNVHNIEEMLLLADAYNVSELQQCVEEYILKNPEKFLFLSVKRFKKFDAQNPVLMSALSKMIMDKAENMKVSELKRIF